jgi:hypothetical protein
MSNPREAGDIIYVLLFHSIYNYFNGRNNNNNNNTKTAILGT